MAIARQGGVGSSAIVAMDGALSSFVFGIFWLWDRWIMEIKTIANNIPNRHSCWVSMAKFGF